MMNSMKMELLAPAGSMEALRAAVQNGANAVYLGAGNFNARRNADNFDGDGLKYAVAYCHARNVKVHVTLNTLVREDEIEALQDTIRMIYESGADAVIVQDFGVARAVREIAPGMEIHASTQMAVHNRQGVDFLVKQGFDRVVLAREMTYEEIAECTGRGAEIEVFGHGALCVACSGQCLMSSLVGGRSGNRGLCAQPCRLPWRLDGKESYLLSTKDLCSLENLNKLQKAGVNSLKIEGRLKRPEYVAVTIAVYRRALDALYEGKENECKDADILALRQMFNRGGFTRGYGQGVAEEELMYPERPNHMGVSVGECRNKGEIFLTADVESADVLALHRKGESDIPVKLNGKSGSRVSCAEARAGDRLFRMVSEEQMKSARESFNGEHCRIPLIAWAELRIGKPATLIVFDGKRTAKAEEQILEPASSKGADAERVVSQLKKTGGTPYEISDLELNLDAGAFCPASLLNGLRRDALLALEEMRTAVSRESGVMTPPEKIAVCEGKTRLLAQSASPDILMEALANGADGAVFAPEDVRLNALNAALEKLPDKFDLAIPAVLGAKTLDTLNVWALNNRERIETVWLSNIGHFDLKWPGRIAADYMLNIGNNLALKQIMDWNAEIYAPSVELSANQINEMGGKRSLIVWGRIPVMHLRHCPLRAVEGRKGLHKNCVRCDGETGICRKTLTDRKNVDFPLNRIATEEGCVIQVLNSAELMLLRKMRKLPEAENWRMLLREDEPIASVTRAYRAALDNQHIWSMKEWHEIEKMNTTTGHYFRGVQ